MPLVEQLMNRGHARINLDGKCIIEKSGWDHSYDFEDGGYASIQEGRIDGALKLEEGVFTEYDLRFIPLDDKKELRSDAGAMSRLKKIFWIALMKTITNNRGIYKAKPYP